MAQTEELKVEELKVEYSSPEKWWKCGNDLTIDKNILKKTGTGGSYVGIGSKLITKGKHEWIVKFKDGGSSCICDQIGITSSFDNVNCTQNIYQMKYSTSYWPYKGYGCIYTNNTSSSYQQSHTNLPLLSHSEAIIKVALDLTSNTLSYYNGNKNNELIATINNLPKVNGWRLVAYICKSPSSWTIINDSSATIKPPTDSLQIALDDTLLWLNTINNNDKILNEIKQLELDELNDIKNGIINYNKLFNNYLKINDEMKKELNKLTKIIDKQITPDVNNYNKWSAKDITRFVCTLDNGKYSRYKEKLLENLIKQEINGTLLKEIQRNDLLALGITSFADRIAIHTAILKIVSNQEGSETEIL